MRACVPSCRGPHVGVKVIFHTRQSTNEVIVGRETGPGLETQARKSGRPVTLFARGASWANPPPWHHKSPKRDPSSPKGLSGRQAIDRTCHDGRLLRAHDTRRGIITRKGPNIHDSTTDNNTLVHTYICRHNQPVVLMTNHGVIMARTVQRSMFDSPAQLLLFSVLFCC
ncbi:hypothetical protein BKA80DRAFT_47292 [Phyllosticta citrichinensis]